MEGDGSLKNGELCPQLLDLISKKREWLGKMGENERSSQQEEKKLELRLGLPGGEDSWSSGSFKEATKNTNSRGGRRDESLLSLGYFTNGNQQVHKFSSPDTPQIGAVWFNQQQQQHQLAKSSTTTTASFLKFSPTTATPQSLSGMVNESSQPCCTKVAVVDLQQRGGSTEKKAFSSPAPANTAVLPNSSQKRTAPGPVVGWPPIRSFRKNLASTSYSKPAPESQTGNPNKNIAGENNPAEPCKKGLFLKINMDGVPIGRKVDLKTYDSYEKLSTAVDELFRGLLAAQRDSSSGGIMSKQEEEKPITGVLGGSGEYTLVYEDNEGDRMLVGDVPWHLFVSTVKRLRVLKSSEVSALSLGTSKQGKQPQWLGEDEFRGVD